MKRPQLTAEQVRFWFEHMSKYDITVLEQRKRLIDTFVNAIFVYNDRIIFTFNYKRDAKTVLFSDLKSSDMESGIRPKRGFITNPRFSFISSHNLLKSRVFTTNIKGLFFPALRVEQARFSHLTTCLTTYGDFWLNFSYFLIVLRR